MSLRSKPPFDTLYCFRHYSNAGEMLIRYCSSSFFTDVTGYIAVDKTRDLTVLAFRGSHSVRNYLADVDLIRILVDICSGCTAHQGFWDSWVEARKGILAALVTTAAKYPSSKVVVVGHSLGGAIAGFAAAEIRNKGINADLYTYGAPRIGGQKLSDFITNQSNGQNFRVTHSDDPVPRLPPQQLGYAHISPEYWITSATNIPPTPADIIRLDGSNNLQGNGGQNGLDGSAHLWYFGDIAGCSPTKFEFKKRDEYH